MAVRKPTQGAPGADPPTPDPAADPPEGGGDGGDGGNSNPPDGLRDSIREIVREEIQAGLADLVPGSGGGDDSKPGGAFTQRDLEAMAEAQMRGAMSILRTKDAPPVPGAAPAPPAEAPPVKERRLTKLMWGGTKK